MNVSDQEMQAIREQADILLDRMMELGCDACRLFVTASVGGDTTVSETSGRGNFNAQYGQVQRWTLAQDEDMRTAPGSR